MLFSARHQGVNDVLAFKIITVSLFSLSYKWRNDLRLYMEIYLHGLYNRMILAIIIIMSIYSSIVVIWDPWILICHPPMSFRQIKIRGPQMTAMPSKWTLLLLYCCSFMYHLFKKYSPWLPIVGLSSSFNSFGIMFSEIQRLRNNWWLLHLPAIYMYIYRIFIMKINYIFEI